MAKVKKRVVLQKIKERAAAARPKVREKMLERADERRAQRRATMASKPKHDDEEPEEKETLPTPW